MVRITNEWVIEDTEINFRHLMITGISNLVQDEVRIYGLFERVSGGVVYSAEDDPHFDDLFTDDLNHLRREAV